MKQTAYLPVIVGEDLIWIDELNDNKEWGVLKNQNNSSRCV